MKSSPIDYDPQLLLTYNPPSLGKYADWKVDERPRRSYSRYSCEEINMHPDGQAWPTPCRDVPSKFNETLSHTFNCAVTDGRITKNSYEVRIPFVCVHRKDDGCFRVCSGWDRVFGEEWDAKKTKG
jgi:hypothetical protein